MPERDRHQPQPSREQAGGQGDGQQRDKGDSPAGSTSEWVVGICATGLVLALLGFVLYHAITASAGPPVIAVTVERIVPMQGRFLVQVRARNTGGTTAAALSIEGTLTEAGEVVETSTATIAYVPAESEREGGLFFRRDPRRYRLEVRPQGYDRP